MAAREARGGRIAKGNAARMLRSFLEDYAGFTVISLSGELAVEAAGQASQYGLKALDSLHFAALLRVREAYPGKVAFVTSDRELLLAGTGAGIPVLDPTAADAATVLRRLR